MKRVLTITVFSTTLAVAGAAFAFYCILPGSLQFFKGFQVSGLSALISADSYLGFITSMIIMFVVVFQIPLIIAFIDTIHPLSPRQLLRLEKWVVIGSLVVALLAPFTYDFVTSILIAVPIIVLYNLSIIAVAIRHRSKTKNKKTVFRPDFSVNENLIYDIANKPVVEMAEIAPTLAAPLKPTNSFMDIKPSTVRQTTVTPADWVQQRKEKRAEYGKKVRLISDIHTSRATLA